MILSIINSESNSLYLTKSNSEVIGDDGKSIGYMQVSRYALIDVNKKYFLNFSFDDLYNEYENLVVGILYFNMCYESALKTSTLKPIWVAFKKYNGGIDETEFSYNNQADSYANRTYNFYTELNKRKK